MADAFTNNQTSSTNEPSVGMTCEVVFYTGNWYASVSNDFGRTFSFIDPFTNFPAASAGFCCDQVVYFEPGRGIMVWYLQYVGDSVGNTVRLAISNSSSNTANNIWYFYDITPQMLGYANGIQFDFPDLSASSNFLYITTNILGASDNAIVFRLDLDDLANANPVALENFTSSLPNLRATHGATNTMYIGTQVDTNTLRIFGWPESAASPTSVDRDVDPWFTGSSAPSPDGTDWVARDFNDILAAWTGGGVIGFMWGSAQGGGFPWPNVRFARFDVTGLGLVDQGQIWNPGFAWAYPAVHPNDAGDVGGTMALGGGGLTVPFPSLVAWIADDFNSDTLAPLENQGIATGNDGPDSNRWGDYFTSRRNDVYGDTWVATGFVLNGGGTGGFTEPRFLWFGREEDAPPPPNIFCPSDFTVECSVSGGTPRGDSQLDPFFGGVSTSDLCDPNPLVSDDAPALFPVDLTTNVTFTSTNNNENSSSCTASVTVEDTIRPELTNVPTPITAECTSPEGTPVTVPLPTASDVCDPDVTVFSDAPPVFPLSTTTVTFVATDASGNTETATTTVTVEDTIPPALTVPPDIVVECTNHGGQPVLYSPTADDVCDLSPTVTCVPPSGSLFSLGDTTVTCTASDDSGNASSGAFTVQVVDTTPPVIASISVSPSVLWPPNHRMVPVTVSLSTTDTCDPNPVCQIDSIQSNEPVLGPGSGNTAPDWEITGPLTARIRAERAGRGDGRVYTIAVSCHDSSGESSVETVPVFVRHNRGN